MSIKDLTITDQNVQSTYVQSQPDRLTGTAQQNKAVFDALPQLIIQRFNLLLEALAGTGAAGEIPIGPIEGVTAENVQQALEDIQKNLTEYISRIKSATGAAEVGVSQISGMTAQNVQKALEELRTAIDNIVSGIIPGGSITSDMLADMTGPIRWGNNRYISGGGSSTDFDFAAGKVSIRLSPENAVGNDISKCVVIRDTGNGALYPIATATPPQARNLTLQSGFAPHGDCIFFVTQESTVFLAGGVSGTLAANQDTQIGTLPADAQPVAQRRRPAVTNAGTAYIDIHTDGTVWAHPFAAASQCWFDASFLAGGGL